MIDIDMRSKTVTVTSESGKLSCMMATECQDSMLKLYNIDISKEVEKLLDREDKQGYRPGRYTFSFKDKVLSLHHNDVVEELKNNVGRIMQRYLYEQNNEDTRLNVRADILNYISILHDKGALNDASVICDATNNEDGSNMLMCRIGVKKDKDSELVIFDAAIKAKGSEDEEH